MHPITVVALGPGASELLTLGALEELKQARCALLRTARHGAAAYIKRQGVAFTTLDDLYEQSEDFDDLARRAARRVCDLAAAAPVCYAVPDPAQDETVRALLALAPDTRVLPGVPLGAPCLCAAPPAGALRLCAAGDLDDVNPRETLLLTEMDTALKAGACKLSLLALFPPEHEVLFFAPAQDACRRFARIPLCELDRQKRYDHTAAALVPPAPFQRRERYDVQDLVDVMRVLTGPGGCPWDREQTHETLRQYIIEEAYETVAAIDEGDMAHVADELGDVLLQVVFHALIAKAHGEFDLGDIATAITRKMIHRHAHIFGDVQCENADEVLQSWEKIKKAEKGLQSQTAVMRDVPRHLPALMRAAKVQNKARQVGFDWDDPRDALDKVLEEAREVREELDARRDPAGELGDLLFAAVNAARIARVEPELALSAATDKFIRRFSRMENAIIRDGKALEHLTLSEMDVYWEEGKQCE